MDRKTENQIIKDMVTKVVDEAATKTLAAIDLIDTIMPNRKLDFVALIGRNQTELGLMGMAIATCEAARCGSGAADAEVFKTRISEARARVLTMIGGMFDDCVARDAAEFERLRAEQEAQQ